MYTIVQKNVVGNILVNLESSLLCAPRLHWCDQKHIKNNNFVKQYYNSQPFLFEYISQCHLIPLMAKQNFQQALLQSSSEEQELFFL